MTLALVNKAYDFLYFRSWCAGLWLPPDRRFLQEEIFPFFARKPAIKKVLFVGVRNYTKDYKKFFTSQEFTTIDIDARYAKFGAPGHRTVDFLMLEERGEYDLILLNGVIGFGIDSAEQVRAAMTKVKAVAKPDAWVVVGTNPSLVNSEMEKEMSKEFSEAPFAPTGQTRHLFRFPLSSGLHEYRFLKWSDR